LVLNARALAGDVRFALDDVAIDSRQFLAKVVINGAVDQAMLLPHQAGAQWSLSHRRLAEPLPVMLQNIPQFCAMRASNHAQPEIKPGKDQGAESPDAAVLIRVPAWVGGGIVPSPLEL
jgi:hypothetical protein